MTKLRRSPVLGPAFVAGLCTPFCLAVIGNLTLQNGIFYSLAAFGVIGAAVLWGRSRAFTVGWSLMLLVWFSLLGTTGSNAQWNITAILRLISDGFVLWCSMALPLAGAHYVYLLLSHSSIQRRTLFLMLGIWLIVFVASSRLSRFAPDVGANPRYHPFVTWIGGPALVVLPLVFSVCLMIISLQDRS